MVILLPSPPRSPAQDPSKVSVVILLPSPAQDPWHRLLILLITPRLRVSFWKNPALSQMESIKQSDGSECPVKDGAGRG